MKRVAAGTSPARVLGAIALLGAGGYVCYQNVLGRSEKGAGAQPVEIVVDPSGGASSEPIDSGQAGDVAPAVASELGDLLALHGSYDLSEPVPNPFDPELAAGGLVPDGSDAQAAAELAHGAPMGEMATRWVGDDPPRMDVSFVLVGEDVARAVVDGRVVGVGGRVTAGDVLRVTKEGVQVVSRGRALFYELGQPWPREFRAELARRGAEQQGRAAWGAEQR